MAAQQNTAHELVFSRELNAPREKVWNAWTDPAQLARWWGPTGFTTTTSAHELRPGGQWRFVMHGPDGQDYDNVITFETVTPPERLEYRQGGAASGKGEDFAVLKRVAVLFEEVSEARTRLTLRMAFADAAGKEAAVRDYRADVGAAQTLARLAELVESTPGANAATGTQFGMGATGTGPTFAIERVVRAPRRKVWELWTRREHLVAWFGPKGWTMPVCTLDLRPGGSMHYEMRTAQGQSMWGKWVFRQIVAEERLVFVSAFSDESGAVKRAPWEEKWPLETLSVITFADHAGLGGGTVIRVEWTPINATPEERAIFENGKESMRAGWTGTFEQLERYVESLGG